LFISFVLEKENQFLYLFIRDKKKTRTHEMPSFRI